MHFALQSFGEWFIDGDEGGAKVTCGIGIFWLSCVSTLGAKTATNFRSMADMQTHHRAFQVWLCLFVLVAMTSFNNARLLLIDSDVAIEWVDKSFHLVQLVFILAVIFTVLLDCDLSFTKYDIGTFCTGSLNVWTAGMIFFTVITVASCRMKDGIWEQSEVRNTSLFLKYFVMCGSTVVVYWQLRKQNVNLRIK